MRYPTSVSFETLPSRNVIGSTSTYRETSAVRLENGNPSRNSIITPETTDNWAKDLSGINHPIVYISPVGCST